MAKKNNEKAVEKAVEKTEALTADEKAVESAVLALAAANLHHYVNAAIEKAGMAISQAEHDAARPLSAIDKAAAALAAVGVDIMSLEADKAKVGKLAMNYDTLAKALGKLSVHIDKPQHDNGTSLITHHIAQGLLAGERRFSLGELIKTVNKTYTMPKGTPYVSTGHVNTIKALLRKAGFTVHAPSGFFIVSE